MGTSISYEDKVTGFQLKNNLMIFNGYYNSIYSWHEYDLTMISTLCLGEGGNTLSRHPYANIVSTFLSPCQYYLDILVLTQSLSRSLHDYSIQHSHCEICSWHTRGWNNTVRHILGIQNAIVYSRHTNTVTMRYIFGIQTQSLWDIFPTYLQMQPVIIST